MYEKKKYGNKDEGEERDATGGRERRKKWKQRRTEQVPEVDGQSC